MRSAMEDTSSSMTSGKSRKKRIPKACTGCRQSKVKCDGQRPCSRCRGLRKTCAFFERPKDANELKMEALERQIEIPQSQVQSQPAIPAEVNLSSSSQIATESSMGTIIPSTIPITEFAAPLAQPHVESPGSSSIPMTRKRQSHFALGNVIVPDVIESGLLSKDQAESYFHTFFRGCDRYTPVFDAKFDTMSGIRARSSLLFGTICTVGCRVVSGTESHQWRMLNFHMKRALNAAIMTPHMASLETVQALLVRACYVAERSLLTAAATRMAMDLGLPGAYDEIITLLTTKDPNSLATTTDGATLMRRTRTWLHLLVLGHILHVDASDLPTFTFVGDVRRTRVLLHNPFSSKLDVFLLPQAELNVLRAQIYTTLSNCNNLDEEDIMSAIRDARIDIAVWLNDWVRILEKDDPDTSWITTNLKVQRCWAETMALCRAVRASGVENVDFMSPIQKSLLRMAKDSLREHLDIMVAQPRIYLNNLRFAMDFVWAKCAFCYLLLLKLSLLLPDDGTQWNEELITHGKTLLTELGDTIGEITSGDRSNTRKLYLQLLQTGIQKFGLALNIEPGLLVRTPANDLHATPRRAAGLPSDTGQGDLESFVPEQFIFEWDFPGLTLFSSSTTEVGWLDDILLEALNGGEDFYGFGMPLSDVPMGE